MQFAPDGLSHPYATTFVARHLADAPPKTASKNWHDLPSEELQCEWVDDLSQLRQLVPLWKRLAECCLCPNVFYEPQLLLPAWEHLRTGKVRIAVVRSIQRASTTEEPVLCGLFPLEINSVGLGLPFRSAKLWQHVHCFLNTPLVRSDVANSTIEALLQFLSSDEERIQLLHLNNVSAEGPFQDALIDLLQSEKWKYQVKQVTRRALFVRRSETDQFFSEWPRKRRHEINRLERRLAEQGNLEVEEFHVGDDPLAWAEKFIEFESLGWKGNVGTSISASPQQSAFLRSAASELASENRLMGLTLSFNGEPIAMKLNFLTHDGGFAFKIAFHPDWAKHSPGTIMEKLNVVKLHEHPRLRWMDSCAAPNHPMIDALWPERRTLQSLTIAMHRPFAQSALAMLPLAKYARDTIRGLWQRA
ncbi:GNAT family N-acetyltransferase [Aureliella helgolandensis]|uniref:BioF2-like acetyltransferase domain-containing protein n=1 Tax=Aureliella helgolandensis TaxID=2527968 RepID=A0A518GAL5_9BACT|nr:GNAT family N-acetyltransferase [Aureliella helgolandensis]QDV25635.1 hypothetical protein Q31a_39610 [Aureliella helgolandensis]